MLFVTIVGSIGWILVLILYLLYSDIKDDLTTLHRLKAARERELILQRIQLIAELQSHIEYASRLQEAYDAAEAQAKKEPDRTLN